MRRKRNRRKEDDDKGLGGLGKDKFPSKLHKGKDSKKNKFCKLLERM